MSAESAPKRKRAAAKIAVTEQTLADAALAYLNRRDASRGKLRQQLERWIARRGEPIETRAASALIDALLLRYERSGLVNDQRVADNTLTSLRARGASTRAIRFKLAQRGVGDDNIEAALSAERAEEPASELSAARAFVRKRRLGPYRDAEARALNHRRDLATLARAGFDFDTARRALGGESNDDEF